MSFKENLNVLGKIARDYINFSVPIEKEIINIEKDNNEGIVKKVLYDKDNNLVLIVQDLWQVHYQILLIISQKESTKLNVKIVVVSLNMKVPKTI